MILSISQEKFISNNNILLKHKSPVKQVPDDADLMIVKTTLEEAPLNNQKKKGHYRR